MNRYNVEYITCEQYHRNVEVTGGDLIDAVNTFLDTYGPVDHIISVVRLDNLSSIR